MIPELLTCHARWFGETLIGMQLFVVIKFKPASCIGSDRTTWSYLVLFSFTDRCEARYIYSGNLKGSGHTPLPLVVCSTVLPLSVCRSIYDGKGLTGAWIVSCCALVNCSHSSGRSCPILVCSHRLGMCMFRIDMCPFFYTPARLGICLYLLDQYIFFVPSPEPVYLEQSMVTKQQIHTQIWV